MVAALIVDDSAAFRATLRQVLMTRFPFLYIAEAMSVSDALVRADALKPNIFFVDVRLPDGSGLDLVRRLACGYRSATIGVVTSFDVLEYRLAAREAGAGHYIAKGNATSADVIAVVDSFLERHARTLVVFESTVLRRAAADSMSSHWPSMIVVEAKSENDGVARAAALRPNLALVSYSLLRAVGPGLCETLRAGDPGARVIAVGRGMAREERAFAHRLGADHALDWSSDLAADVGSRLDSCAAYAR